MLDRADDSRNSYCVNDSFVRARFELSLSKLLGSNVFALKHCISLLLCIGCLHSLFRDISTRAFEQKCVCAEALHSALVDRLLAFLFRHVSTRAFEQ